jgi:hypothetical protein
VTPNLEVFIDCACHRRRFAAAYGAPALRSLCDATAGGFGSTAKRLRRKEEEEAVSPGTSRGAVRPLHLQRGARTDEGGAGVGGPVAAEPKMQFSLAVAASFPPTVSADLRLTLLPIRKHT